MKTVDEPNTMTEPQSIDVWDDNMGWNDVEVGHEEDEEDWNYWNDDRYSCGCCRCCGCDCWIDYDEEEEEED